MKKTKAAIAMIMVVSICLVLVACGISQEEVVGTWSGSWEYNGKFISCAIVFNENGSYAKATLSNGSDTKAEVGTYEIKGGEVRLHPNGNTSDTIAYKYKGGALVNNGHELFKK